MSSGLNCRSPSFKKISIALYRRYNPSIRLSFSGQDAATPQQFPLFKFFKFGRPRTSIMAASLVYASAGITFWKIWRQTTPTLSDQMSRMCWTFLSFEVLKSRFQRVRAWQRCEYGRERLPADKGKIKLNDLNTNCLNH